MTRKILTCACIVALAGACEPREPPDRAAAPPAEPTEQPAVPAPQMTPCSNPTWGYRIAYPAEWRTNDGEVVPACSLFDPEPIAVEPRTELPLDLAVLIQREPVAFERVTAEQLGRRLLSREELTLDGRRAVRLEAESTGEAMRPAGGRSYEYVVDLNGATLLLSTHDVGDPAYERKKQILDEMAATLRLTGS